MRILGMEGSSPFWYFQPPARLMRVVPSVRNISSAGGLKPPPPPGGHPEGKCVLASFYNTDRNTVVVGGACVPDIPADFLSVEIKGIVHLRVTQVNA